MNMRMQETLPEYAAVFIHYKDPCALAQSLSGMLSQTHPPCRIFVVDNSHSIAPLILSTEILDFVTVIPAPRNGGYSYAVNLARQSVESLDIEYVLVATQDVLWEKNTAAELVYAAERDEKVSCVGPILRYRSDPDRTFSKGGFMGFGGRNVHILAENTSEDPYQVDWLDGAVMLLRIHSLNDIGWLDEGYFLYYEEVDLCFKLRDRLGRRVIIAPNALAYQEPGNYTPYLRFRNQIRFWRQNLGGWQIFPAIGYQLMRSTARAVLHGQPLNILWALRGILDGAYGRSGVPPQSILLGLCSLPRKKERR